MTLRSRIFTVMSLIILFVLGVSMLLIVRADKKKNAPESAPSSMGYSDQAAIPDSTAVSPESQSAAALSVQQTPRAPSLDSLRDSVKQFARVFMERYATYSTDSNFQNIREVESMATPELWANISKKIGSASASGGFVGVTARVVTLEMKNWNDVSAEVGMKLVKIQEKNGVTSNTYSDATVWLIKFGDKWLVEKFELK